MQWYTGKPHVNLNTQRFLWIFLYSSANMD